MSGALPRLRGRRGRPEWWGEAPERPGNSNRVKSVSTLLASLQQTEKIAPRNIELCVRFFSFGAVTLPEREHKNPGA
jgi:hypothetical protein